MSKAEVRAAINLLNEIEKQGFEIKELYDDDPYETIIVGILRNGTKYGTEYTQIKTIETKKNHYRFEFNKNGEILKSLSLIIDWSNIQPNEEYVTTNYDAQIKTLQDKILKLKSLNEEANKIINE